MYKIHNSINVYTVQLSHFAIPKEDRSPVAEHYGKIAWTSEQ